MPCGRHSITQWRKGVFIEQEVLTLTRVVKGQTEHARMELVFSLDGPVTFLDVSIVAPFSCNPSPVSAASTKPALMAKRAEKNKFDRYGGRYGGVDRRHAAVARCTADVIHSNSGTMYSLNRRFQPSPVVNGQREHARMDLVFNLNGFCHVPRCCHCVSFFQHLGPHCSSQHPPRPHGQES